MQSSTSCASSPPPVPRNRRRRPRSSGSFNAISQKVPKTLLLKNDSIPFAMDRAMAYISRSA
eukprot:9468986-Pyramimonas_sp.AAC.1